MEQFVVCAVSATAFIVYEHRKAISSISFPSDRIHLFTVLQVDSEIRLFWVCLSPPTYGTSSSLILFPCLNRRSVGHLGNVYFFGSAPFILIAIFNRLTAVRSTYRADTIVLVSRCNVLNDVYHRTGIDRSLVEIL